MKEKRRGEIIALKRKPNKQPTNQSTNQPTKQPTNQTNKQQQKTYKETNELIRPGNMCATLRTFRQL